MNKANIQLMNDTFEIEGTWYLPGQNVENNGVQGILKYTPHEIILELIGIFKGTNESFFQNGKPIAIKMIYGFSSLGEWITLYDCFVIKAQMSSPGFDTVSYGINHFYIGSQIFENENEKIIEDITFSFTYLDAWMNIGITERRKFKEKGKIEWSINLERAIPQKKSIKIFPKNICIEEEIQYNIENSQDYFSGESSKIHINRFYRCSSIDNSYLSFNNINESLHQIRRLLTLLIGRPLYFLYIDINFLVGKEVLFDEAEDNKQNTCRLFFTPVGDINKCWQISPYRSDSMLLFRKDIKEIIELIFENWFSLQDLLSEIINPYISDLYLPTYQEIKFLNTVRSLEVFHRAFIEHKASLTEDDFDTTLSKDRELIISFIQEHISEENQCLFMEKINYEDEHSLQNRLKEIFRLTPDLLINRLFGELNSKQRNKIALVISQTRNYLTHRDNKEKYPFAINNHIILNGYISKLNVLLQFHVLKCIGVEPDIIEKRLIMFSKNYAAFDLNTDK